IRAASASFSARALAAMAFTASNSSRGTKSISATSRSSRWRTKVSISVRTLWAMPAASVKAFATPSRNGLSVCAIEPSTLASQMGILYGRHRHLTQDTKHAPLTIHEPGPVALPPFGSRADTAGAAGHPLVCPGVYRRHRAGLVGGGADPAPQKLVGPPAVQRPVAGHRRRYRRPGGMGHVGRDPGRTARLGADLRHRPVQRH